MLYNIKGEFKVINIEDRHYMEIIHPYTNYSVYVSPNMVEVVLEMLCENLLENRSGAV